MNSKTKQVFPSYFMEGRLFFRIFTFYIIFDVLFSTPRVKIHEIQDELY